MTHDTDETTLPRCTAVWDSERRTTLLLLDFPGTPDRRHGSVISMAAPRRELENAMRLDDTERKYLAMGKVFAAVAERAIHCAVDSGRLVVPEVKP